MRKVLLTLTFLLLCIPLLPALSSFATMGTDGSFLFSCSFPQSLTPNPHPLPHPLPQQHDKWRVSSLQKYLPSFIPRLCLAFSQLVFPSYQSVICPQYTIYEQRKSDLKTISCGTILCECRMQHLTRAGLVMHSKDGFRHMCVCLCMCATSACLCVSSLMMTFLHTILLTWGLKQNQDRQICGSLSFCCSFFLVFLLCV